jgi:hypothetical protein
MSIVIGSSHKGVMILPYAAQTEVRATQCHLWRLFQDRNDDKLDLINLDDSYREGDSIMIILFVIQLLSRL